MDSLLYSLMPPASAHAPRQIERKAVSGIPAVATVQLVQVTVEQFGLGRHEVADLRIGPRKGKMSVLVPVGCLQDRIAGIEHGVEQVYRLLAGLGVEKLLSSSVRS